VDEAKEQAAKKMIEILTKYLAGGEKTFPFHGYIRIASNAPALA
jgi:hypothetical protein